MAEQDKDKEGAASEPNAGSQPTAAKSDDTASQPAVVEYVVSYDADTGAVKKVETVDANGKRTELTPAEYSALDQLQTEHALAEAAQSHASMAAVVADPFGLYGTPSPAALAESYDATQLSPEAQAYYLGYTTGYAQIAALIY